MTMAEYLHLVRILSNPLPWLSDPPTPTDTMKVSGHNLRQIQREAGRRSHQGMHSLGGVTDE
jgi:hypothetical protein